MDQGLRFFEPADLKVTAWSRAAWEESTEDGVVWVVKESLLTRRPRRGSTEQNPQYQSAFWEIFSAPDFQDRVRILSSFADEAHVPWRSANSERSVVFKKVTANSELNVLVSGTMFPRCPSSDAEGILEHLGGESGPGSKWSAEQARAIRRLTGPNEIFSILTLRILLAPFYLRRTLNSHWLGRWIIDQKHARPQPTILLPYPDDFSQLQPANLKLKTKTSETKKRTQFTMTEMMHRADQRRFYAWTELFLEVQDFAEVDSGGGNTKNTARVEKLMIERLPYLRPSGRVRKLIAIIKAHRARGEKFVIVSDRIFLLQLAYYVSRALFCN